VRTVNENVWHASIQAGRPLRGLPRRVTATDRRLLRRWRTVCLTLCGVGWCWHSVSIWRDRGLTVGDVGWRRRGPPGSRPTGPFDPCIRAWEAPICTHSANTSTRGRDRWLTREGVRPRSRLV
jgi:hypothetical protein